ncbi:hypothetical protein FACS189421_12960 [Bacteroidia bacterium]|nr:hypothetical protein FACS189421_12960 [Bacteroidia bacterium]GHT46976.1 hypothetical protein FACS189440_06210 [Bacteroidia bacterium]
MKATESKTTSRYINLLNDWGFKYIFGKKENLIHFLNEIFQGKEKITDIAYLPTEQLGKTEKERIAIFDVYCRNNRGEFILLEMQNMPQLHFYERSLLYSTFLIRNQAVKGEWNYELKSVYVIGILNFIPSEVAVDDKQYVDRVSLFNERTKKKFSDILNFIYIVLPKFNKKQEELNSQLDDWLYILRHSKQMAIQPETIRGKLFDELFKEMEIKRLTPKNMKLHGRSELKYEDASLFTDYAEMKGREKGMLEGEKRGILEGKRNISKNLLEMGMSISDISRATGLTPQQIQQLN